MLIEDRFIQAERPVVKVGRTTRSIMTRFNEYPKNSILLGIGHVNDCIAGEKMLLDTFKELYVRELDIGLEYFSGDIEIMETTFHDILLKIKEGSLSDSTNIP